MTKVIHVHLIYEKKNFYFGSISAIFDTLTESQVGITKSSLLHAGLTDGSVKYTKRVMITQSHLIKSTRKGWNSLRTSIKPLFAAFFVTFGWYPLQVLNMKKEATYLNVLKGWKIESSDIWGFVWGDKKDSGKTKCFKWSDIWSDIIGCF